MSDAPRSVPSGDAADKNKGPSGSSPLGSTGSTPAPTPVPLSKGAIFVRRLSSTVCLWTVVLLAVFSSSQFIREYVFLFLMMVLATTGLIEFYGLVEKRGFVCFKWWGVLNGLLMMVATFFYITAYLPTAPTHGMPSKANDFETAVLIFFVLGLCVREFISKERQSVGLQAISTTLFGLMYVPWLLNFIQKINFFPGVEGRYFVLFFIVVTKFSDVGAYCVGSLIGRHKMIPRISPGKTWEGFGGAIVVSTGCSVAFSLLAKEHLAGLTVVHAIILGVILSVSAVIGDLIESLFKREAGVKDSGKFFPGIGGILDLLDSLLFNAPLMYLYLRHVLTH
ncbi:MAG TPA: phosphatidate cytidylyltransferase [Candidatus Limnocylindria bacterium]|jgi:phosphatidate cytidylyltransferase|nr:phosphatidate cytidylyltransferase [Candidatus Limnocylindria bacterium]